MTRAIKGRSRTVTTEAGSEGSSEEEVPKKGVAKRYEFMHLTTSELDMSTESGKRLKTLTPILTNFLERK